MKKTDYIDYDITASIGNPSQVFSVTGNNIGSMQIIEESWDSTLRLGDEAISEDMIQNLRILLETISQLPDDNELKQLFEANMMINKLKKS